MAVVFPGLQCDMLLVVASIGLERLLGTEALQSWLPHQLDLRVHAFLSGLLSITGRISRTAYR